MGLPRTAALMRFEVTRVLLARERGVGKLRLAARNGEEVQVIALGRMQHRLDRRVTRVADRPDRQARVHVRVVWGVDLQFREGGGGAVLAQAVDDRAVELQVHADLETVVNGLDDLPVSYTH